MGWLLGWLAGWFSVHWVPSPHPLWLWEGLTTSLCSSIDGQERSRCLMWSWCFTPWHHCSCGLRERSVLNSYIGGNGSRGRFIVPALNLLHVFVTPGRRGVSVSGQWARWEVRLEWRWSSHGIHYCALIFHCFCLQSEVLSAIFHLWIAFELHFITTSVKPSLLTLIKALSSWCSSVILLMGWFLPRRVVNTRWSGVMKGCGGRVHMFSFHFKRAKEAKTFCLK